MVIGMSPSQAPRGEGGVTPRASRQFSAESRRTVRTQSCGQLELPVRLVSVSPDCGRKAESRQTQGGYVQCMEAGAGNQTDNLIAVRETKLSKLSPKKIERVHEGVWFQKVVNSSVCPSEEADKGPYDKISG